MLFYVTSDPATLHQVAGVLEAALLVEMIINKDNASGSLSPESCRGRISHSNLICSQKAWGNQRYHHLRAVSMWTAACGQAHVPHCPLPHLVSLWETALFSFMGRFLLPRKTMPELSEMLSKMLSRYHMGKGRNGSCRTQDPAAANHSRIDKALLL